MRFVLISTAVTALAIGLRFLRSGSFSPDLDTAPRLDIQLTADESVILGRLSAALSHKTVSSLAASDHILVPENFKALHATLFDAFPEAFKSLKLDVVSLSLLNCCILRFCPGLLRNLVQVNKYSLMLTWPGSNPKLQKRPTVFISHIDVVAAGDAKAEAAWTHPPFSGKVADG